MDDPLGTIEYGMLGWGVELPVHHIRRHLFFGQLKRYIFTIDYVGSWSNCRVGLLIGDVHILWPEHDVALGFIHLRHFLDKFLPWRQQIYNADGNHRID